jgi:hypothetical protein
LDCAGEFLTPKDIEILLLILDTVLKTDSKSDPEDFHVFISSTVLYLKKFALSKIPILINCLVFYSERKFCFSVLEQFVKYTADKDMLELFLEKYMEIIRVLGDDEAILFIENGSRFFSVKNINSRFVSSLIEKGVFTEFLNEMDRLAPEKRIKRIIALLSTIGKLISYDPLLCEEFVNVDGYDRVFDLYFKVQDLVGFFDFYIPLLWNEVGGIDYLHHSAGIDYLFVKKSDIQNAHFKQIYLKIIKICTESNFWNLNICRNARLLRSLLLSLDFLVSLGI